MLEQRSGKIFIVEDNDLNMKLFCDLLGAHGYEVGFTQQGAEAIEMIRRFMPHLVLMDIQLQGVSGLDLIRQIKTDKYIGATPILAITAFAMKDDRERILASGCDGYMTKPISIEPFLEAIAKFIDGQQASH